MAGRRRIHEVLRLTVELHELEVVGAAERDVDLVVEFVAVRFIVPAMA